jgi:hypothetical protein
MCFLAQDIEQSYPHNHTSGDMPGLWNQLQCGSPVLKSFLRLLMLAAPVADTAALPTPVTLAALTFKRLCDLMGACKLSCLLLARHPACCCACC